MEYILFVVSVVVILFVLKFAEYIYKLNEVQLEQKVDNVRINQAKAYFDRLNIETSFSRAKALKESILKIVTDNITIWDELGFTEAELQQKVDDARVTETKIHFDQLSTETALDYAKLIQRFILKTVTDGLATWDELGFTEAELQQKVDNVRNN